jgi:hypothetical protein
MFTRATLMALLLWGCADDGTTDDPVVPQPDTVDEPDPVDEPDFPDGPVAVRVDATYTRPAQRSWDGLDYANLETLPIRGAEIWVTRTNSELILASGVTTASGEFVFEAPSGVDVEVHIAAHAPAYELYIRDNTADDALWVLEQVLPAPTETQAVLAMHAGLAHDGSVYTDRASAPFAILDTMLTVSERVDALVDEPFIELDVFWSPDNVPSRGDSDVGEIGTSKHVWGRGIYILGAEGIDTDEYDDTVLAHEWFHFFEHAFSRSESKGGSHGSSSILHMSVAWSEGAVTGLGNLTLNTRRYIDSSGFAQSESWENDVERNRIGSAIGWYGQRSVSSILWDLVDAEGDEGDTLTLPVTDLFDVLTGPFVDTPALTSIFSFGHALRTTHPEHADAIDVLWNREDIVAPVDPWGTGETNDGGDPDAVAPALYRVLEVGESDALEMGPTTTAENRTSDFRYYRFTPPVRGTYEVLTEADEDVDLSVFVGGDVTCDSNTVSGNESCTFSATPDADYVFEVDGTWLEEATTTVTVTVREVGP